MNDYEVHAQESQQLDEELLSISNQLRLYLNDCLTDIQPVLHTDNNDPVLPLYHTLPPISCFTAARSF
jgi:hypothetical protein